MNPHTTDDGMSCDIPKNTHKFVRSGVSAPPHEPVYARTSRLERMKTVISVSLDLVKLASQFATMARDFIIPLYSPPTSHAV